MSLPLRVGIELFFFFNGRAIFIFKIGANCRSKVYLYLIFRCSQSTATKHIVKSRLQLRGRDLENRSRDVRQTIGVLLAGHTGGALLERNKLRMRLSGKIILILSRQEELGSRQNNSLNFSMWNQANNLLFCKLSVPEDPGPTRVGQMQRHDVCRVEAL